eukprot:3227760-Lingulodinium_polyedra.AAC.1
MPAGLGLRVHRPGELSASTAPAEQLATELPKAQLTLLAEDHRSTVDSRLVLSKDLRRRPRLQQGP